MGIEMNGGRWVHYDHLDSHRRFRWTARESYQFMYNRPWNHVIDFYSDLVCNAKGSSLEVLFPKKKHKPLIVDKVAEYCGEHVSTCHLNQEKIGRLARTTFKIILSYHGGYFDGWQKQPGLNTVQGLVEKTLGRYVDENKALQLKAKSLPLEVCVVVAGRTDKGVNALGQVCAFYTWKKGIQIDDIKNCINAAAPGKLRALHISEVPRAFHPNFSATWRRYLYIFPIIEMEGERIGSEAANTFRIDVLENSEEKKQNYKEERKGVLLANYDDIDDEGLSHDKMKPRNFSINKVNRILYQLEGKTLSYKMFARDTKASRSTGPHTNCFMFHARAAETRLPSEASKCSTDAMCVEMVANRFLRKMVRVIVSTAIREAAAGSDDDALLKLMDATSRRATAPPAPPHGLCLVDVGYGEFKKENCFIQGEDNEDGELLKDRELESH